MRLNSRTSRLHQYCLLARNQNSRMPTLRARSPRLQCLAQHAGLRVNNELGLRPQYSLPSSSVLDCGLTLTRTVLEAAHHCPRSTTSLPSSSVLDCGLTLTRRGCPPLPAFDDEPCAASRRHCTASSDLRSARDTARGEAITLTRRSGSY